MKFGRTHILFRYAMHQWPRLLVLIVLSSLTSVVGALQPWPMKILVDHALNHTARSGVPPAVNAFIGGFSPEGLVVLAGVSTVALFVASSLLSSAIAWTWAVAGQQMVYDLAGDLFKRLQRVSLPFHTRIPVGDSLSLLTADSWGIYALSQALLIGPVRGVFTISTIGVMAWRLDSKLTLLSLTVIPALGAIAATFGQRLVRRARANRAANVRLLSFLQRTLPALPIVKAFGAEERNSLHFRHLSEMEIDRLRRNSFLQNVFLATAGIVPTLGIAVILFAGGQRVLAHEMSLGTLLVFLAYLKTMQGALRGFLKNYATVKTTQPKMERVFEVLSAEDDIRDMPGARALPRRSAVEGADIRIENVVFGYEPGRPILRNVTMEARRGEMVALVGATGAGKSTLVGLVPRFFDPWEGRVTVDGIDVKELQLKSLRDQIALVLQDAFILPLSIADNIAYGRPDATREEIEAVAHAANAHEFIERLPERYDTVVGERGATLSGGERQRLAIARAFLKDAPILILDEPTSALDAGTESLVLGALDRLMHGRTVLVIAHRLSTVRRADRIVVMEQGEIVEQGTHEELLAAGGKYQRLHDRQFAARSPVVAA